VTGLLLQKDFFKVTQCAFTTGRNKYLLLLNTLKIYVYCILYIVYIYCT
jgi:hypothetical protein